MKLVNIILPINPDVAVTGALAAGTIVSLRPEPNNIKDPNAVQAFLGDEFVGYLANSKATIPQGCVSASNIVKILSNKSVAGVNAKLISCGEYKTTDEHLTQTRWIAEVYPLPVWETKAESDKEVIVMKVGGPRVLNSDKATVMSAFSSYGPGDLVCKMLPSTSTGSDKVTIWRKSVMGARDAAPAGEVSDPPVEVLLALQRKNMLPVTPVRLVGRDSYEVSVELNSSGLEEFIPDMDEVVKNCIMQVRDVKERVNYLLSQAVPSNIVRAALHAMRPLKYGKKVSRPRELFIQTLPDDYLSRALVYHLTGKNIRLIGEKGSGKNTLASSVCWVLQQPLCRVQGNADMDKVDMLGSQALNDHGTTFELSSFIQALQNGEDVVLDEINAIKPEIAVVIHSLTDDARSVDVPGYGYVEVHPLSRIWATMNEGYVGTGEMNPATVDRFTPIYLTESFSLSKLLTEMFPDFNKADIDTCQVIYNKILQAVRDSKCLPDAITTRGYIDAIESAGLLPLRETLLDNVGGRSQDEESRTAVKAYILAAYPT